MTKSNVSAGKNAGVFYIDYDNFNMYQDKTDEHDIRLWSDIPTNERKYFKINKDLSQEQYEIWCNHFCNSMQKECPSLKRTNEYINQNKKILLQNQLFDIIVEDNRWGLAIELIPRKKCDYPQFQNKLFSDFLIKILKVMTPMANTIYSRTGSWNVEPVSHMNQDDIDRIIKSSKIKIDKTTKAVGNYNIPKEV